MDSVDGRLNFDTKIDTKGFTKGVASKFTKLFMSIKKEFNDIFKPFKSTWDKDGKKVTNSIKYAFKNIWKLIRTIDRSFAMVWTNGTGEKTVSYILSIFTNINTTIGNIAANLKKTWTTDIPGISERTYTDEELDEMNRKENEPREFGGRQYTAYEAQQRQRKLETVMRAQRQEIKLLKEGGADEDDIINARARYRGTSHEYARFSEAMGIPQQRERVTVDGLGNIGAGKYTGGSGKDSPLGRQSVGARVVDKVTPEERRELLKRGIDKSAESGIISTSGLGSKDSGFNLIEEHEPPKLIKTIDPTDNKVVMAEIESFEKSAVGKQIETACVVTKDGEVYHCFGVADRVYPDSDLGDKLYGASVTHNHPIEETEFSFSNGDFELFEKYNLKILRGCDEKFVYELNRNAEDIDGEVMDWQFAENFRHSEVRDKAFDRGYGYRRKAL